MPRTLTTTDARNHFGKLLDDVHRGDHAIISRAGRPMAAVIPIDLYEQRRREREAFFSLVDEIRSRNRRVEPGQMGRLVRHARRAER